MRNKKSFIGFFIVIIFFLAGFILLNHPSKTFEPKTAEPNNFGTADTIKYVKIAGQNIKVDLALTQDVQAVGLSGRSELLPDQGMLFVFAEPGKYYFWMKEMNFPIDMIWLAPSEGGDGASAKVVYIKKDAQPENFPETYGPDLNTKYVLEVGAGFSDKNNLNVGDSILFTY